MTKKKSFAEKRNARIASIPKRKERKEQAKVYDIASAFIMAINDNYITYRQFKEIQTIIDARFDKPIWTIKSQPK